MEEKKTSISTIIIIFLAILIVALVAVIGVSLIKYSRYNVSAKNNGSDAAANTQLVTEKWQEGIINYKGKYYKYNSHIDTYLLLGIDKSGKVKKTTNYNDGGQSDVLALFVVDNESETFSLITIHRNTMCDVDVYTEDNEYKYTANLQLCLQHAFGDGQGLSCRRTVEAVKRLFDNIPIDGYVSLNMDALPIINDSVGGVQVEVLDDLNYPNKGVNLKAGDIKTLNGNEAYVYIRGRDTGEFDSASARLRRQEQYIASFMSTIRRLPNKTSTISSMYDDIKDYVVTNVLFDDLLMALSDYELTEDHIYSVPGEVIMGEAYEEFYVDEDALYDLIIEVFYNETEAPTELDTSNKLDR